MMLNQNSPLVSVILPTYNRERFIGEAIQSILDQTYENFEVIVVDDGSEDKTKEIVSSFEDKRITYIYQKNRGRSFARNVALQHATGDYITFIDSDDLYHKEKIEKQVYFLETNKNFSMVYTSANCIDAQGNILKTQYKANASGWIYPKIAYFVPTTITLPTVMVRKEVFSVVGEFDENLHRFEDTDMWRRISKKYKIAAMKDVTCLLRTHDENHLRNQDPDEIIINLKYYINKVLSEDREFSSHHRKGFNKFLSYYITAFSSVSRPSFELRMKEIVGIKNQIKKETQKGKLETIKDFINLKFKLQKKKKILFVAFPDSIHSVRWINQVSRDDYEVYIVAPYATEPHEGFDELVAFYPYRSYFFADAKRFIKSFFSSITPKYGLKEVENKKIKLQFAYNFPMSQSYIHERFSELRRFGNTTSLIMKSFGPRTLKKIIQKVKPDLIHSLEFQTCSYNVLFTKKLFKNRKFPSWLATNWGSDIYFYRNDPAHLQLITDLLENIDYYSCECHRDVVIAKELGYRGGILPVMPNTGGIDIKFAKNLRDKIKPSLRKIIMVKGYQNFAGRALTALDAIEECASLLQGYQVFVYSVMTLDVQEKIKKMKEKLNISIDVLPHTPNHLEILRFFSKARIYFSISMSDGISTSLLESMAMGAFPIQTNTSCCNEWIKDGVSGSIISPDNFEGIVAALKTALKDDALVDKASALNWETIQKKADKEECAKKINAFYNTIFDHKSSEGKFVYDPKYEYQINSTLTNFSDFLDREWIMSADGGAWLKGKTGEFGCKVFGKENKNYVLHLNFTALVNQSHPLQRVRISLNGHKLGTIFITADKTQESLNIPRGLIKKETFCTFKFEPLDAVAPKEIGGWDFSEPLSVFFSSFQLCEVGDEAEPEETFCDLKKCSGI